MLTDWVTPEAVAKIDEPRIWVEDCERGAEGGLGPVGGGVAYLFIHLPVACQPTSLCQ